MPPVESAKGPEVKPLNEMPEIPPPVLKPPCYKCWLTSTFVLVTLLAWFLPWKGQGLMFTLPISIAILGPWLCVFALRLMDYIGDQRRARFLAHAEQRIQDDWQARNLHKAALVQVLLVGAAGHCATAAEMLFGPRRSPTQQMATPEWISTLVGTVTGEDCAGREQQLAALLARHWHAQQGEPVRLQPLRCYWLGSLESWQTFVAQVAETCPDIWLPPCPEPWQGIDSLYAIINQLQDASEDARILCAGCQTQGAQEEAALLWLFGPQGRLLFSRGDWSGRDAFNSLAVRMRQPIRQKTAAQICVSFAEHDLSPLSSGWERTLRKRNPRFDVLADLPDMLAMTQAAWRAEYAEPQPVWRPNPAHRSKVLGIIQPEGSSASANSARTVAS